MLQRNLTRPLVRRPTQPPEAGGGWTPPAANRPAVWSLTDGGYYLQRSDVSRTLGKKGGSTGGSWRSARASSGIASGSISTRYVVAGSANIIVGLSTGSATMQDFLGSDLHGFGWVGSSGDVLRNSGAVANFGTYGPGDVLRVDVNFAAKTAAFYKNDSPAGTLDFSALSGTVYPTGSAYDAGTVTIDCGQTSFTPGDGFTAGPVGPWGGWHAPSPYDVWLHDDLTGLWVDSGETTAVTIAGDPVGAWNGGLDQYTLANSLSAARLEYQSAGILLNSTGVTKYLYATISRDPTLPFYAAARMVDVSGQTPRFNTATAALPRAPEYPAYLRRAAQSSAALSAAQTRSSPPTSRGRIRPRSSGSTAPSRGVSIPTASSRRLREARRLPLWSACRSGR
jgi:hypothetical protein